MIEDQVLAEIRKIKDDLASQYGCDVRKMLDDAVIRQRNSEHRVVNLCMKKRANPALQRTGGAHR